MSYAATTMAGGRQLDCEQHDMSTSLLYSLLPALLQQRVPVFPSIRRTASTFAAKSSRHIRVSSDNVGETTSGSPPPSYRTSLCETEEAGFRSLLASPAQEAEAEMGVKWKFARQGYALLSLSTQEAGVFGARADFSRKLYVDGLEYLLRGLPEALSEEERAGLRSALPSDLLLATEGSTHADRVGASEASLLHRSVATLTLSLFLLLSLVTPYVQLLLRTAYRYDRKHKIRERVCAQGVIAADALGRRTWVLVGSVCAMREGRVGEVVRDVVSGVAEGVGEGMEVCGFKVGE
ncbi:hypothetical protein EJ03DRAFT_367696 [Teratosphaeria nubilosa]|uniref:Uncharacterized protein n=1 Tax=Teratosphaeria nubilosa TaxID=161662 RepID=A0A6G1L0V1_9PEZI|nr:hypothetical protein EJ03DRAFT_367696 [Teratosphaeria nubilosa]